MTKWASLWKQAAKRNRGWFRTWLRYAEKNADSVTRLALKLYYARTWSNLWKAAATKWRKRALEAEAKRSDRIMITDVKSERFIPIAWQED